MRDVLAFQSVAALAIVANIVMGLVWAFSPREVSGMTLINAGPCQTFGGAGCELTPRAAALERGEVMR